MNANGGRERRDAELKFNVKERRGGGGSEKISKVREAGMEVDEHRYFERSVLPRSNE